MAAWLLRSSSPFPSAQCFFCGQHSTIVPPSALSHPGGSSRASINKGQKTDSAAGERHVSVGTARAWTCAACECSNRADARGNILSDEPAMHDSQLNARSFERRGHPSTSHLPHLPPFAAARNGASSPIGSAHAASSCNSDEQGAVGESQAYADTPFCHSCLTNQTLVMNLLANYLPDEDDPSYASALRSLPAYRESLDARYPPVCASCLPGVRARISERDRSARASVLGGWLARSSSRSAQRDSLERAPGTPGKGKGRDFYVNVNLAAEARERAASRTAERIWTLRGVAWSASTIAGLVGSALGTVASDRPSQVLFYVLSRTRWQRSRDPLRLSPSVPTSSSSASFAITPEVPPSLGARAFVLVLALISVFWTCWDPTWRRVARARRKGVRPAVTGREHWVRSQLGLYFTRLLLVTLALLQPSELPAQLSKRALALAGFELHLTDTSVTADMLRGVYSILLVLQIFLLSYGFSRLRTRMPMPVRLVPRPQGCLSSSSALNPPDSAQASNSHCQQSTSTANSRPGLNNPGTSDPLSALSLNNVGPPHSHFLAQPTFGQASLGLDALLDSTTSALPPDGGEEMDWAPTSTFASASGDARTDSASVPFSAYSHASGSGAGHGRKEPQQVELGPQRFFPPEQPTGLEDLFGSVLGLKDADEDASANAKAAGGDRQLKRGGSSGAGAGAGRQDQMRKMAIASLLGAGIAFCAVAVVKVPSTSIWNVG